MSAPERRPITTRCWAAGAQIGRTESGPVIATSARTPISIGSSSGRPNYVWGVPLKPDNFDMPSNQFNIKAFTTPKGAWGNLGRNMLNGPAAFNWDSEWQTAGGSVQKNSGRSTFIFDPRETKLVSIDGKNPFIPQPAETPGKQ